MHTRVLMFRISASYDYLFHYHYFDFSCLSQQVRMRPHASQVTLVHPPRYFVDHSQLCQALSALSEGDCCCALWIETSLLSFNILMLPKHVFY